MNLVKLFETQKALRDRIDYDKSDRFDKLKLSLLVELGELANESRFFKFWSKDQKPRTHKARHPYMDADDADFYNPQLEEYVDCLHFLLELGIELKVNVHILQIEIETKPFYKTTLTEHFNIVFGLATIPEMDYAGLFNAFVGLGEFLGYRWEEVEAAYFAKNKINHIRQDTGY
jgi:dimeric dUTPase (all-alpha-NTP-PPase superfamily)